MIGTGWIIATTMTTDARRSHKLLFKRQEHTFVLTRLKAYCFYYYCFYCLQRHNHLLRACFSLPHHNDLTCHHMDCNSFVAGTCTIACVVVVFLLLSCWIVSDTSYLSCTPTKRMKQEQSYTWRVSCRDKL